MANVLFISVDYLKNNSVIDENVDNKYLTYAIKMAQDERLQELIGTDLLEELADQVAADNLTAANTSLLNNFVVPYLLAVTVAESVVPMYYKFRNKSILTMGTEEGQTADKQGIGLVYKDYANKAQFKGERLRRFLLDNHNTYPLFLNGNLEGWKIRPSRTAYQTGLFLGNQRKPYFDFSGISSFNPRGYLFYDCNGCP